MNLVTTRTTSGWLQEYNFLPMKGYAQFSSHKLFKVRALSRNYCLAVMASAGNWCYSLFWRERSNRFRISLVSSTVTKKAFERCQRKLNPFESNASLVYRPLDSQNKTLQTRFVGLPFLQAFNKVTTLHCTRSVPHYNHAPRFN